MGQELENSFGGWFWLRVCYKVAVKMLTGDHYHLKVWLSQGDPLSRCCQGHGVNSRMWESLEASLGAGCFTCLARMQVLIKYLLNKWTNRCDAMLFLLQEIQIISGGKTLWSIGRGLSREPSLPWSSWQTECSHFRVHCPIENKKLRRGVGWKCT